MCTVIFQSLIGSLNFIVGGKVCPGAGIAAVQQSMPGPGLSHSDIICLFHFHPLLSIVFSRVYMIYNDIIVQIVNVYFIVFYRIF